MSKLLDLVIHRPSDWPDAAQEELAELAREIDAELHAGTYRATADELAGIDRGLRDSAAGRFATEEAAEAIFAKHRRR
jgi:predicted transcriptional regulator